ncbi:hypothetical protein OIV83_006503 [Microbotryomycetes sp. JL201]|nr:hypothetical protein OIV83_006503 [Microbotryomycetes sp. JL201]
MAMMAQDWTLRVRETASNKQVRELGRQPRVAQISGSGLTETPVERLRRLRTEIAELEEDVQREKLQQQDLADSPMPEPGISSSISRKKGEVTPAVLLQQLQLLKGDIQAIEATQTSDKLANSSSDPALLAKHRSTALSSSPSPPLKNASVSEIKALPSVPAQPNAAGRDEYSSLEARLAHIERLLGTQEADVDEPRHLDSISRRVKVLVTDLERLHEARRKLGDTRPLNVALSGGMTVTVGAIDKNVPLTSLGASAGPSSKSPSIPDAVPLDTLQKIDTLFALVPRLEPLIPLAPRLLARLRSLSTLHASAAEFSDDLAATKIELEKLTDGRDGLKEVIAELSQSLSENETRLKTNLDAMDKRMQALGERMDNLRV